MSSPITLTPAGMTLSGSYLFNYPKDTPNREVEALLSDLFPQPCWDWTKHDGEANVFLHKTRVASWLLEGDARRKDDLTRQRLAWECQMLPLTPEAVRLVLDPPPKPVEDKSKSKTVSLTLVVKKTYTADLDYDTFVEEVVPKQLVAETDEAFDARCLSLWKRLLKKTKGELELTDADEDGEDEDAGTLMDWYDGIQDIRDLLV